MGLIIPIFRDLDDARSKHALQQFLTDLRDMAFQLTLLNVDGGVDTDTKPYNFDGVWVQYVSNGSADTEDTVAHKLERRPRGALVGLPDKSAVIYDSGTTWDKDNIYLKSSAATTTVNLVLF